MNAKHISKQASQSESVNWKNENTLSLNTYLLYLSLLDIWKLLTTVQIFQTLSLIVQYLTTQSLSLLQVQ